MRRDISRILFISGAAGIVLCSAFIHFAQISILSAAFLLAAQTGALALLARYGYACMKSMPANS